MPTPVAFKPIESASILPRNGSNQIFAVIPVPVPYNGVGLYWFVPS
jgi:hypothetical protein